MYIPLGFRFLVEGTKVSVISGSIVRFIDVAEAQASKSIVQHLVEDNANCVAQRNLAKLNCRPYLVSIR